jgi:crossover junction endodeoxyribonuclease RuvC
MKERIILGIDPGTQIMGYGIIHCKGKETELLTMGVLKLDKYDDYALKLKKIFERTTGLIDEFKPDEMAIEAPFFGKNVQSMLKLGRAQGVAIAAAMNREIIVTEYSPKKIKQSITGNGNASKEQVSAMLQHIFKFKEEPQFFDATDGLAAAFCHFIQSKLPEIKSLPKKTASKKKSQSWASFVSKNPGKIVKK